MYTSVKYDRLWGRYIPIMMATTLMGGISIKILLIPILKIKTMW